MHGPAPCAAAAETATAAAACVAPAAACVVGNRRSRRIINAAAARQLPTTHHATQSWRQLRTKPQSRRLQRATAARNRKKTSREERSSNIRTLRSPLPRLVRRETETATFLCKISCDNKTLIVLPAPAPAGGGGHEGLPPVEKLPPPLPGRLHVKAC